MIFRFIRIERRKTEARCARTFRNDNETSIILMCYGVICAEETNIIAWQPPHTTGFRRKVKEEEKKIKQKSQFKWKSHSCCSNRAFHTMQTSERQWERTHWAIVCFRVIGCLAYRFGDDKWKIDDDDQNERNRNDPSRSDDIIVMT